MRTFIPRSLKKFESADVGQPPLLSPPASDSKSGCLLGIFKLFERSRYTMFFAVVLCVMKSIEAYDSSHMEMHPSSYGFPEVLSWGEGTKLYVEKYCSISSDVTVVLGGDHRIDWVTTYPFMSFWPEIAGSIQGHPRTKGNVFIGNDVWIGRGAFILSGVTIGNGAVVGAMSVVTKNVPPYAIVAGNPARIVKYRFDEATIEKLLDIAWWEWPVEEIAKAVPLLLSDDIQAFIEYSELKAL